MMNGAGKKNLIITLGVITLLLFLYYASSYRSGNPDIPELEEWSGPADEITISRNSGTIRLYRKDGMWRINREGFPADPGVVEKMGKKLRDLQITDLSSRRPHYERFGLTPENTITVVVKKDGDVIRNILIGNKSSKTSHTFIRVGDRPEIYKVSGVLRSQFGKSVEGYRDRNILNETPENIVSVGIHYSNTTYTFARESAAPKKEGASSGGNGNAPDGGKIVCLEDPDIELHPVKIANLMKSFNPLQAQSFPDVSVDNIGKSLCTVTVKTKKKSVSLDFYKGSTRYSYYCTSSESPYIYNVASYTAEKYMKEIQDFKR